MCQGLCYVVMGEDEMVSTLEGLTIQQEKYKALHLQEEVEKKAVS